MTNVKNIKDQSALVKIVLSLDTHFASLERLSERIDETELKSDFDIAQARKLMLAFSESAHAVSTEFVELAQLINEAKTRSEVAALKVAKKAEQLQSRQSDEETKFQAFNELTAKVSQINEAMKALQKPEGTSLTDEDKVQLAQQLAQFELQLRPLIEEALVIKKDAQKSQLKVLEQNADALGQSLTAASKKLTSHNLVN